MEVKKNIRIKNGIANVGMYDIEKALSDKYIIVKDSKGNQGVLDKDGNLLIDCKFDEISYNGYVFICRNLKNNKAVSIYDEIGFEIVYKNNYVLDGLSEEAILLRSNSQKNYMLLDKTCNKKTYIDGAFYDAGLINNLFVGVEYKNKKDCFITKSYEKELIDYDFDKRRDTKNISCYQRLNDAVIVAKQKKVYLINNKGEIVNEVRKIKGITYLDAFNNDIIITKNDRLIVKKPNEKPRELTNEYDKYCIIDNLIVYFNNTIPNTKCEVYTKDGRKYTFDSVLFGSKRDNYIKYTVDNKEGIINTKTGDKVLNPTYASINYLQNGVFEYQTYQDEKIIYGIENTKENYGFIFNEKECEVIDDKNYQISFLGEYMFLLKNDEESVLYSVCDRSLTPIDCTITSMFHNGDIIAHKDYKYGIIDNSGNIVVPFVFDSIIRFGNRYIINDILVDLDAFKYDYSLELYSDNKKLLYERKFKKYENMDAAYDYFCDEIKEYEMRKDKYQTKIENQFSTNFKDEDIRKIKRKQK